MTINHLTRINSSPDGGAALVGSILGAKQTAADDETEQEANGRVKLNQLFQPVAQGAVSGMLWASLIGLLFMMPLAGAAIGAASGALNGRLADLGINDDFMKRAARTLQSGNAALFLLTRKMTADKVLAALQGAGGTVMRSSFDETKEEALQAALAGARAASADAAG